MANPQLRFDRKLCDDCPAQSQCSIGRFAVKFVLKNIEPEVDMARIIISDHIERAFEELYIRDSESFGISKKVISDELNRTFDRYNQSMVALDELLETVFNAQELPSETVTERILDQARQDFMSVIDIGTNGMPTLDELTSMSKAAKEWRDESECIQDFIR